MRNLTLGQYVPGNSYLHNMDSRAKLIVAIVAMCCLFAIGHLGILALVGLFFFIVGIRAGIPAGYLWRGLRLVLFLAFFTLAFNAFLVPGKNILIQWEFISVSREGLEHGSVMALRFVVLMVITSLLSLTTAPLILTDGIEKLLTPLKFVGVPAHELALVSTIALRFVPTLAQDAECIMKAQLARNACLDRGPYVQRLKAIVSILVPLFVSAFRYADELAQAMEARCYRGGVGRTHFHELNFTKKDAFIMVLGILFMSILVAGDYYFG